MRHSAAKVSRGEAEGPVRADLLAGQETMPFHIQVANPRRYRGLPMSVFACVFFAVFLLSLAMFRDLPKTRFRSNIPRVLSLGTIRHERNVLTSTEVGRKEVKLRYYIAPFCPVSRTIIYIFHFYFSSPRDFLASRTIASLSTRCPSDIFYVFYT